MSIIPIPHAVGLRQCHVESDQRLWLGVRMFIIFECAACVLVAIIVATLAVSACAIFMLLYAGRGIMGRTVHQLMQGASWLPGMGLVARIREP